jgi:arylsulfate sulfotransferase
MKTRQFVLLVAGLSLLSFAIGCSSSGSSSSSQNPPPPPPQVTISISPDKAAIATGGAAMLQVTLTNDTAVTWTVNGVANGDSAVGEITTDGLTGTYTAPPGPVGLVATVTATSVADTTKSASATVYAVPPGAVTATANSLVADYSITPPSDAQVSIQFGTDTTYGRATSMRQTPQGGGAVSTLVAGMLATTLYHMQAIVNFPDGTQYVDVDQTFTSGAIPAAHLNAAISATTTSGMTPQSGIEMLDLVVGGAEATDLAGNIIWYYGGTNIAGGTILQPIRMLRNGHFALVLAPNSSVPLTGPPVTPTTTDEIREIDLAGTTVRSLNITDLNTRLANAGFTLNALVIHHELIELPNGHWIFFVNLTQDFTDLPGFPGTTTVLGDAIIDVDQNLNPVWVWNSFDHLDINRHPFQFPDWTHANAILYTSDGDLLVSVRHQNWIIKIDYKNGQGSGDVLWRLGQGGDFTLMGGTDPTDWTYAQHGPAFFGRTSAGVFDLGVMDNGDDRAFPQNLTCQAAGFTTCPFTTVPIYHIDENAMTATLLFHDVTVPYSFFGGDVASLANGDVEFDLCSDTTVAVQPGASVTEVTREDNPQVVWRMSVGGDYGYRMFRQPSLYPGVHW